MSPKDKITKWVWEGNVNLWAINDYDGVVDMLIDWEEQRNEVLNN